MRTGRLTSRILLIYPPSHLQNHSSCPVGLQYLAAALEQAGHEVRIVDADAARLRRTSEDIAKLACEYRPHVIGMTIVTQLAREAYRLASLLKVTGARLLAGGPHPSLVPEEPLQFGFDAVCVGEGEPVIAGAVDALLGRIPLAKIPGLSYRDTGGHIHSNPPAAPPEDLDSLPRPARHLVRPEDYYGNGDANFFGNIFSSRGCPCRCSYCAGGLFGRHFRFRSASDILEEISSVHEAYGTTYFHFVDDGMTINRERAIAICEGIIALNLGITWSMMTRIDTVDQELLALAARSGCIRIDYGVESGHPETLKRIHKPHTVAMVKDIIAATRRAGITPMAFFIVGFPWETSEHIKATLTLMKELSPYLDSFHHALASILIPFPGTEVYESYKDEYDLHQWWLKPERSIGVPKLGRHAYFEEKLFPVGSVLDADFFRYSSDVRNSILQTMRYMHHHNNHNENYLIRTVKNRMIDLSLALQGVSPTLEHIVMGAFRRI